MKFLTAKKSVALVASVVVVAIAAVGAYAYWTTSGTGSGTAATGDSAAFVVTQVGTTTGLVPDGTPQDVAIKVNNPALFNQYLTSLTFVVDPAWSKNADIDGDWPVCNAGDFNLTQPSVANVDLTPGDHSGATYTGTIQLDNAATNQNNCKNVTVDLILSAN